MAIKSKKEKEKHLFIKTSPYDIPEVVLELVSKICLAVDTSDYPERLGKPLSRIVYGEDCNNRNTTTKGRGLYEYFFENRYLFSNKDFYFDVVRAIRELSVEIRTTNNDTNSRVVVAGGFNAGKSTFINNALVGEPGFLPVNNLPTTSVATSVYFTSHENDCRVKAVNLKGVVVNLDERILQVIRHRKKTKNLLSASDFIMSVIREMFIEIKSDRFAGYTFVDTPGFGNTDKANDFNGKSDDQIASEMFQSADFLLWITDGQLDSQDLKHISLFKGPFAIMLNKVGESRGQTKDVEVIRETIEANYDMLNGPNFGGDISNLVDVFAYSYPPDEEVIRCSKKGFKSFDDIISAAKKNKPKTYKYPHLKILEKIFEAEIRKSRKEIENKEQQLSAYSKHVHYLFNQKEKKIGDKEVSEMLEFAYLEGTRRFKSMTELKENIESHVERIKYFKRYLMETIKTGEEKYKEDIKIQDATTTTNEMTIFEAIDSGDDLLFRKSLSGVDLFASNKEGYTPLTYAVKSGNNTMVKILLNLGAEPENKDKNGKNAFHVAVECQFRDMCEILYGWKCNNKLWDEKTNDGKSIWDLATQNLFCEWIEDFYNRTINI